jgi:hypothetical protein
MQFHHEDRAGKEFSISMMMSSSWDRIRRELDKCRLLCSNCHAEMEDEVSGA